MKSICLRSICAINTMMKTPMCLCLAEKKDGDGYWVVHGRYSQPHPNDSATLLNSFQTELLLDDEHASQEFDETERAMRAQVGILENLSHKKCATDRKFVKQQPRTLAIRSFQ